jgi:hypothetical protein
MVLQFKVRECDVGGVGINESTTLNMLEVAERRWEE